MNSWVNLAQKEDMLTNGRKQRYINIFFVLFNLFQLTVIDKDREKNGAVELFMVEGDDSFALNRTTGALVVNKPLSLIGNNMVTHRLLVEARDGGNEHHGLSSN